jgi:hypothetical protein
VFASATPKLSEPPATRFAQFALSYAMTMRAHIATLHHAAALLILICLKSPNTNAQTLPLADHHTHL